METIRSLQAQLLALGLAPYILGLIVSNAIGGAVLEELDEEAARRLKIALANYVELAANCKKHR